MSPLLPPSRVLDNDHFDILFRAVRNVLVTDIAVATFAQIIDGLPTRRVYYDNYHSSGIVPHPLVGHDQVCPGAEDEVKKLRAEFDLAILHFRSSLLEAFQYSTQPSLIFDLRLIELVSVSLHQIAVLLHQRKEHLHDPSTTEGLDVEEVTLYHPPRLENGFRYKTPQPTMFSHLNFTNWKKYPNGVDDMAGYWAENRILGGVPLFKRSSNPSEKDPELNVYFQSSRYFTTFRVWQLLDKQQNDLIFFLTSRNPSTSKCPLPILPDKKNGNRCDPDEATPVYHIYRDIWERTPPEAKMSRPIILSRCGGRGNQKYSFDYPELEEQELQLMAIMDRLAEEEVAEEYMQAERQRNGQEEQGKVKDNNMTKPDTVIPREDDTIEQGKSQNNDTAKTTQTQTESEAEDTQTVEAAKEEESMEEGNKEDWGKEVEHLNGTGKHDMPKNEDPQRKTGKLGKMTTKWRKRLDLHRCSLM